MRSTELVQWFRQSTPYVNMHRGKTFVIMLDGDAIAGTNFINIISDISLLHSLGIKSYSAHGYKLIHYWHNTELSLFIIKISV